ncbi:MAG: hypothetical protein ACLS4Z_00830 [Christensenellaceae bacterium]
MEERIIDDEYARGIRLKKTKDGYVDATDELVEKERRAAEGARSGRTRRHGRRGKTSRGRNGGDACPRRAGRKPRRETAGKRGGLNSDLEE